MLNVRQVSLVQDSFARVVPVSVHAAAEFYRYLFAFAPDTRALFRGDMGEQGRKLFLTLAAVVDALDQLEELAPMVQDLAIRHVGYGALDRHYLAVGSAMIETLRMGLGTGFDAETEAAWRATYDLLATTMLTAAHGTG